MADKEDSLVRLVVTKNVFETQQVEALLEEAGIQFAKRTFTDTALDGLFVPQKGYAQIEVPKGQLEKAKQALQAMESLEITHQELEEESLSHPVRPDTSDSKSLSRTLLWLFLFILLVAGAILAYEYMREKEKPPKSPMEHKPIQPDPMDPFRPH